MSTWPYPSVAEAGSSQTAAVAAASATAEAVARSGCRTGPGRRCTRYSVVGRATALAMVSPVTATVHGTAARMVKTTAANGG